MELKLIFPVLVFLFYTIKVGKDKIEKNQQSEGKRTKMEENILTTPQHVDKI